MKIIPPATPSSFGGLGLHLEAAVLTLLNSLIIVGVHGGLGEFLSTRVVQIKMLKIFRRAQVLKNRLCTSIAPSYPFLAYALHQAFAETCLPANNGQPPAAAPEAPWNKAQLPQA